nr:4-O-methyltransferase [Fagopyrum tataricum]
MAGEQGDDEGVTGRKELQYLELAFTESMAVKCILELRIPDIIHSHGSSISLSQIAMDIGSPSLNIAYLSRVMRLLVHKKVFTATHHHHQSAETLYGLTHSSRLLLRDNAEMTMAPILLMNTNPWLMDPWHQLSAAIKDGVNVFNKAYGSSLWELASTNPELNNMLNSGLECVTKFVAEDILKVYKDGFQGIETLVDVGGGKGCLVSEIVKAYSPRIKGINFDLKHVVETAPEYNGVTHVGGDMFDSIPNADAIIMKSVLRNWSDEHCIKILSNCKTALSKAKRKLIVVETVVEAEEEGSLDELALKFDLLMMVHCVGGRERTRLEWIKLLKDAGFSQCKFTKTPHLQSIIEAYAS